MVAEIDSRRVDRILRNLINNAIDHAERLPVEIELAADDDALAITVTDHGVGLKPGEAGLVFNRFWRADPSRQRHTGGTGLGLSISLEDARLHGGWLQAYGVPGRGARFRLTLPRRRGGLISGSPLPLRFGADRARHGRPPRHVPRACIDDPRRRSADSATTPGSSSRRGSPPARAVPRVGAVGGRRCRRRRTRPAA